MRVVCLLDELITALGREERSVAHEIGISVRTLQKVRANRDGWRLSKTQLERLMLLAFEHGYRHGLFEIRPHPIWQTFSQQPSTIFRGSRLSDASVETGLRKFLEHFERPSSTQVAKADAPGEDVDSIREAMATRNCLFVGSPKTNPASEVALSLLWDAEPFVDAADNRAKIPVQILGMTSEVSSTSAVMSPSTRHGFLLKLPGWDEPGWVRVTWRKPDDYRSWVGQGQDAAVLVVARRPIQGGENVTTVIVAGYTGRATLRLAEELTHGDPPVPCAKLEDGRPLVAALAFDYRKHAHKGGKLSNLRKDIPGTLRWGPPWEQVIEP